MTHYELQKIWALALCCFLTHQSIFAQRAVVIVPVADLMGEPLKSLEQYKDQPVCGGNLNPFIGCTRIHQLLFNEMVELLEERRGQVRVAVPNFFYVTEKDAKKRNEYWMLKENIVPLSTLERAGLSTKNLPEPITTSGKSHEKQSIVTLTMPHYDHTLQRTFSSGTRFVIDSSNANKQNYRAFAFDPVAMQFVTILLPKQICVAQNCGTHDERIAQFVRLIRSWTILNHGAIPYVWGGTSFCTVAQTNASTEVTHQLPPYSYYTIDGYNQIQKTGFDCTGLVARAAQICGIPYYFKNSTTVVRSLEPLKKNEALQEGDLIWVPRHIMVVGSLEKNTLLEARHYSHGYGKVQEIALSKVFKGIGTYADLQRAYFDKKPLHRMDTQGQVRDTFAECKLLRLASVWSKKL